jgi:NitT/TauT family transport system substrate-binding protein
MAPVYLADELGFFRQAGLQVEIQPLSETTQMIPLLASGRLDVAFASAIPAAINAISKGALTRIVAAREIAVPGCVHELYGNRRSFPRGLQDLRVLQGKRVSVTAPTSLSAFLLDVLLDSVSLQTRDVQLLTMRLSESVPALVAGQIDAVVDLAMEFASAYILPGPSVAGIIPGFQYTYIHFGRSLLEGGTETGAAFLRAYLRGVREFRAGRTPRAFEQLASSGGMDPALVRASCRARVPQDARVDVSSVQRMIDWSVKKGFVPVRVDASQVIDTRFVEQALLPSEATR